MFQGGVNVSIIVSARIVSYTDWKLAQDCYGSLYDAGMKGSIRKALTKFSFAHQKYWIIDGKSVHLSTGRCVPLLMGSNQQFFQVIGVPAISLKGALSSHIARPSTM